MAITMTTGTGPWSHEPPAAWYASAASRGRAGELAARPVRQPGRSAPGTAELAGPGKQEHRIVVGGSRLSQVDHQPLPVGLVQVEGLVSEPERPDDRVVHHPVTRAWPPH